MSELIPEGQLTVYLIRIFILVLLGILFTQSGLDKIFNWKSNLDWLKQHFASSILKNQVPVLLNIITLLETAAGLLSFTAIFTILFLKSLFIAKLAISLATLALIFLFTGQRLAKDYAGAAALISYFIVCIIGLYLML